MGKISIDLLHQKYFKVNSKHCKLNELQILNNLKKAVAKIFSTFQAKRKSLRQDVGIC